MNINNVYLASNDVGFNQLRLEVLRALTDQLSPKLTYHTVDHTEGVLADAIIIAAHESVAPDELMKIKIAALCHDTGFMFTYQNHEEVSCDYAQKILPKYGISDADMMHICEMIMATKIPQSPKDHCGQILADADLAYLGTDTYQKISGLLFDEIKHFNPLFDLQSWIDIQIKFLTQHQYFTAYCIQQKSEIKNTHLQGLMNIK